MVSYPELLNGFARDSIPVKTVDVQRVFAIMDRDNNGQINLGEFKGRLGHQEEDDEGEYEEEEEEDEEERKTLTGEDIEKA